LASNTLESCRRADPRRYRSLRLLRERQTPPSSRLHARRTTRSALSTGTSTYQIAKEKLRHFEGALARGEDSSLPTRTTIPDALTAYVAHIRAVKTAKIAQKDIYYLRDAFGPVCDAVNVTSRKLSVKAKKRPPKPGQDRRRKAQVIVADYFEQITTAQIAAFMSGQVASRGLAPKTANRYREILTRLFNWSMTQNGIRMPGDKNLRHIPRRSSYGALSFSK
jgi:hypothetical protein